MEPNNGDVLNIVNLDNVTDHYPLKIGERKSYYQGNKIIDINKLGSYLRKKPSKHRAYKKHFQQ